MKLGVAAAFSHSTWSGLGEPLVWRGWVVVSLTKYLPLLPSWLCKQRLWPLSQVLQLAAALRSASALPMRCYQHHPPQEHPFLQQKGNRVTRISPCQRSNPEGQPGSGAQAGHLSFWRHHFFSSEPLVISIS